MTRGYEMVIGLEVHIELMTESKIFCGCSTAFGASPNTQCCPVCTGMPGALPVLNEKVVELAIKAGLATGCDIASCSKQDRKNYFYPDLPKAYQISQYDLPLCEHGKLTIETKSGEKDIGITRIHIEEDAGKLVHSPEGTLIDFNRCGVPLIEIVSEPDMRSAEEAVAYLKKLRAAIVYAGVSECRMNEGQMRCDVNLSVRKEGDKTLGTRTEMKNLNSFQFIAKAIEFEFARQVGEIEDGGVIVQETRRFDQERGKTFSMRKKEEANDYCYFPDPDLLPIVTSKARIEEIRRTIPALPDERKARYVEEYGLTPYDAETIVAEKSFADFFEVSAKGTTAYKALANLMITELFRLVPDGEGIDFSSAQMASIVNMQKTGEINGGTAKKVLRDLYGTNEEPRAYVDANDLGQIRDRTMLSDVIDAVLAQSEKIVSDYLKGKDAAKMALVGQVMKKTNGRADAELVTKILKKKLGEIKKEP